MKLVNQNQGSESWLQWRNAGVTASDMPIIMGLSPYKTIFQLWLEKTGRANPPDLSGNPHVQRGHALEDVAWQTAETHLGEIILPACGECSEYPVLRASFDGLTPADMPVELKAPSDRVFSDVLNHGRDSATYKLYEAQVFAQCVVAGSREGLLMFYREGANPLYFDITLTSDIADRVLECAERFWTAIQSDKSPPMDPARDLFIPESGECEWRWRGLARDWRARQLRIKSAEDEVKRLKAEQKLLEKALVSEMGDALLADYAGVKVTRYNKRGTIDHNALLKALEVGEDVQEQYRKPAIQVTKLTLSDEGKVINEDVVDNKMDVPKGTTAFV